MLQSHAVAVSIFNSYIKTAMKKKYWSQLNSREEHEYCSSVNV